jgi:Tfp pilus assembly protein PilP
MPRVASRGVGILIFIILVFNAIPFLVSAKEPVQAITIESMQVIQIIPQEEKAIIKTPDAKRHILKVGDSIGKNGKVTEIVEGRIVIEERTEKGLETIIIRIENGKQRIERIRKVGDKQPVLYSPK